MIDSFIHFSAELQNYLKTKRVSISISRNSVPKMNLLPGRHLVTSFEEASVIGVYHRGEPVVTTTSDRTGSDDGYNKCG